METIALWSQRYSPSKGIYWVRERDCEVSKAKDWLKIFQDSEPNVNFFLSQRKPSTKGLTHDVRIQD